MNSNFTLTFRQIYIYRLPISNWGRIGTFITNIHISDLWWVAQLYEYVKKLKWRIFQEKLITKSRMAVMWNTMVFFRSSRLLSYLDGNAGYSELPQVCFITQTDCRPGG